MAKSTLKPTRKLTGGRYKQPTKRLSNLSTNPIFTKIGEKKIKLERTRGGHIKSKLLLIKEINVYNPKTKKTIKTEIKSIIENNANRHFVRRGILTKGATVDTPLGKAIIRSRPGQESILNGILI